MMTMKRLTTALKGVMLVAAVLAVFAAPVAADEPDKEMKEIKKQIQVLTEEVERMKLGGAVEPLYESYSGLGPAASKVYGAAKGVSLGGYGELVYHNYQDASMKDYADAYRLVLYAGYKYSDKVVLNTELEFEHGGFKNVGGSETGVSPAVANSRTSEVYVEFSYLDFLISKPLSFRTGLMLVPIGMINEYHEPTVYNGVLRPDVETNVIPTTWRELGVMAYGKAGIFKYNAAFMNGLRSDRFTGSGWIRNGRQQGAEVNADGWAGVVRLEAAPFVGLNAGATYYRGEAKHGRGKDQDTQGQTVLAPYEKTGKVQLWEAHAEFKRKTIELKALYAKGTLQGNGALEAAPPGGVGKEAIGYYVEAAVDVLPHLTSGGDSSLTPFIRYEKYDTNKRVFNGYRDSRQQREVRTAGVSFKPNPYVVLKADYQWRDTGSVLANGKGAGRDENKVDQLNLGIGFIF